jgi:hypothetical protein
MLHAEISNDESLGTTELLHRQSISWLVPSANTTDPVVYKKPPRRKESSARARAVAICLGTLYEIKIPIFRQTRS